MSAPTPYRVAEGTGPNFGGEIEYTYVIKQQQGTRFSGDRAPAKSPRRSSARCVRRNSAAASSSTTTANPTSRCAMPTTMDVCYRHINLTSKVVACFTLEKQPLERP